jgi:Na+-driven multidrug efflux pump
MLDTVTPVKISLFANIFNAVLDPIMIFSLAMGVPGAALATLAAEMISAVSYMTLMRKKEMIRFRKIFSVPSWVKLKPLLKGGAALQLRNFALNLTFLMVTRVTQSIDDTGVAAAAHALAIQTFQVGGIVLLALSTVAQTVVPNEMVEKYDPETDRTVGGVHAAKAVINRLMRWGLILGTVLGAFQLAILPLLHQATPMLEVRQTARLPSYLASLYQVFNGMVFIGEGIMIGCGNYMQLSLSSVAATAGCLWALKTLPGRYGLAGVWLSFGVFNSIRLIGVMLHQMRTGPLAPRNLEKSAAKASAVAAEERAAEASSDASDDTSSPSNDPKQ